MKFNQLVSASFLLMALTGCAGPFTDVTKTSSGFETPTDANKVEILYLHPAPGTYREVGVIVTEGWGIRDVAKMHNAIREKAATAGATGVVLLNQYFNIDPWLGTKYQCYTGVAIRSGR